jgi:hypothetical protein
MDAFIVSSCILFGVSLITAVRSRPQTIEPIINEITEITERLKFSVSVLSFLPFISNFLSLHLFLSGYPNSNFNNLQLFYTRFPLTTGTRPVAITDELKQLYSTLKLLVSVIFLIFLIPFILIILGLIFWYGFYLFPQLLPLRNRIIGGFGLFVFMLAGMFARTLWDAIHSRVGVAPVHLDVWKLVLPTLISPIIFLVVWNFSKGQYDILTFTFSFQNGFFWQTVFGKVVAPSPVSTTPPPSIGTTLQQPEENVTEK